MLNFYDTPMYLEEEFLIKMRKNLIHQFALDTISANDLALEILEILSLSDSKIEMLTNYFQYND